MALKYQPLTREETKAAIHGSSKRRPPAHMHKWPGEGLFDYHGEKAREVFEPYPSDVVMENVQQPGMWEAPEGLPANYKWAFKEKSEEGGEQKGKDSGSKIIEDWEELDDFLNTLPDAKDTAIFESVRKAVEQEKDAGEEQRRYVLAKAFNYFYERLWQLRGMENILMDFHLYPDELKRLCDGLLQVALQLVEGAAEAGADGFVTSNDLGHQEALMMRPDKFREVLKPLHVEMARACHKHGMDYWMHSCGNLTDILDDLIEAGVDCLHPLQYGAMDWSETARVIRGRMTAWPGIDVQHILREGTTEQVREHVRELIDTFYLPGQGRCVVAAGNGITGATPLSNIDAFLDETLRYGLQKEVM